MTGTHTNTAMTSPEPVQPPAKGKDNDATTTTTTDATASNNNNNINNINNNNDRSAVTKETSAEKLPEEQYFEKGKREDAEREEKAPEDTSEENPPLPPGPPPGEEEQEDGWQPVWDPTYGSYYFYNSKTGETTWTNPRVPEATDAPLAVPADIQVDSPDSAVAAAAYHDPLQYNPAIHGDYDPTAPYAQPREEPQEASTDYTATAAFNRFTGKFTSAFSAKVPENYNDENKSRRQMEFYFDVDAAANSHNGKSLKAERQTRKLSKKELKAFKEKRRTKKEEKRKAWLKD
ncbi:WW domain-containing protein [Sphaerosporella brunnea]|uniref:WW domain-containing protein n=1 Tax=Sphaerosporella brunnea TaxID=1250544 RepID=A0A5J5EXC9_9PEZI|nr:WW domain-containing protein [Sphaerosporella brunnea]